ncbi:hypothetical protein RG48_07855 [Escherichia coli]|nr:hypothetical protein RG48_07855 [Escherichia coli]
MMSLWDALRMNMMISYQELVRTFPSSHFLFLQMRFSVWRLLLLSYLRFWFGLRNRRLQRKALGDDKRRGL